MQDIPLKELMKKDTQKKKCERNKSQIREGNCNK
jgi:hypothetical protein